MEDIDLEQMIKKYPFLENMSKYCLFTTEEDFKKLKNSKKIVVNYEEASIEFLKRIVSNDKYFDYALKYLNNEIDSFVVSYVINGDNGGLLGLNRSNIVRGIEKLVEMGEIKLGQKEQERFDQLKESISFEKFLNQCKYDNYDIEIEGIKYSIPIKKLISVLQLSDKDFDDLCSNDEIKDIDGIPKEHLLYAAYKYFHKNKYIDKFLIPDSIIKHYIEIGDLQKIELQHLNKLLVTIDTKYKDVHIDSELEKAIISGMPKDATDLEKAIYIYIKMCKLFTYDEEYFAVNQIGEAAKKHKDIGYVSSITLDNNEVVCFEFNLIYAKLLNDLGLHFRSEYKNAMGEDYGEGHANLVFRSDKFLVSADSVTNILKGDILQAKLNQPLVGLKCINRNQTTQKEFREAMTKMYKLIAQQDENTKEQQVEHVQTLDELLEEYSHTTDNISEISLDDRLSILIDKVNSSKMVGIDSLSYILQLRKILFTEEQLENNISVSIIRNNNPFEEGKIAMATTIITLNENSFLEGDNSYYYFNPNHELMPITKEELQEKFDNQIFAYVKKGDPKIPGIVEKGGLRK